MPKSMRTVGVMSLMSLQVTPRYHGSLEAASSCEVVFDLPEAPLRTETRSVDRQMVINSFLLLTIVLLISNGSFFYAHGSPFEGPL